MLSEEFLKRNEYAEFGCRRSLFSKRRPMFYGALMRDTPEWVLQSRLVIVRYAKNAIVRGALDSMKRLRVQ
jgi:hypothetical protein